MRSRPSLASVLVLLATLSCKKEDPPPQKVERRVDLTEIPDHDPEAMAKADQPVRHSSRGRMNVQIGGEARHLTRFPPGKNAAIHDDTTKVDRLILSATADADLPALDIVLTGVRIDRLELPKTFTDAAGDGEAPLRFTFVVDERTRWASRGKGDASLVLEGFEGNVLRGRFEAPLEPLPPNQAAPTALSGDFEIELRLRGVSPG